MKQGEITARIARFVTCGASCARIAAVLALLSAVVVVAEAIARVEAAIRRAELLLMLRVVVRIELLLLTMLLVLLPLRVTWSAWLRDGLPFALLTTTATCCAMKSENCE